MGKLRIDHGDFFRKLHVRQTQNGFNPVVESVPTIQWFRTSLSQLSDDHSWVITPQMVTLRFGLRKVARLLLVVLELRRSAKLERGPTILWVVHRWMDRIQ